MNPFRPVARDKISLRRKERPEDKECFSFSNDHEPIYFKFVSQRENFAAYVKIATLDSIFTHAQSSKSEIFGLLAGRPFKDNQGVYILVTDAVVSDSDEINATPGHFNISPEKYAQISKRLEELHELAENIGWCHSHTKGDSQFSPIDKDEQRKWPEIYHVGIVVSAENGTYSVYHSSTSILMDRDTREEISSSNNTTILSYNSEIQNSIAENDQSSVPPKPSTIPESPVFKAIGRYKKISNEANKVEQNASNNNSQTKPFDLVGNKTTPDFLQRLIKLFFSKYLFFVLLIFILILIACGIIFVLRVSNYTSEQQNTFILTTPTTSVSNNTAQAISGETLEITAVLTSSDENDVEIPSPDPLPIESTNTLPPTVTAAIIATAIIPTVQITPVSDSQNVQQVVSACLGGIPLPNGWTEYSVRPDDVYIRILTMHFGRELDSDEYRSVSERIQYYSCISNPNVIQVGQILYLPPVGN